MIHKHLLYIKYDTEQKTHAPTHANFFLNLICITLSKGLINKYKIYLTIIVYDRQWPKRNKNIHFGAVADN